MRDKETYSMEGKKTKTEKKERGRDSDKKSNLKGDKPHRL